MIRNRDQTHVYTTVCECGKTISRTFHIDDLNKIPNDHKYIRCGKCGSIKKAEKDHA